MLLLLACVSQLPGPQVAQDPAPGLDSSDPVDSGDDGAPLGTGAPGCPDGMSPIPTEAPAYCISTYEVTVVDGMATSQAGVMSTVGVTFFEAADICAATPVNDASGQLLGYQRIATLQEWEDAGDGVLGEGGTAYPWGDTFDESKCATQDAGGVQVLDDAVPNGSYPDCVSDFGVYDQIGNEWEWSDPGVAVDEAGFITARAEEGLLLRVESDGIHVDAGEIGLMTVSAVATGTNLAVLDDGRLCAPADGIESSSVLRHGYLVPAWLLLDVTGADFYPIYVDVTVPADCYVILPELDRDGWPVPAKGGGAYYSGWGTDLHHSSFAHTPDFDGSISFRCVWEG